MKSLWTFFKLHFTKKRFLSFFCAVLIYIILNYLLRLLGSDAFTFALHKLIYSSAILFAVVIYPCYQKSLRVGKRWLFFYIAMLGAVLLPVVLPVFYGHPVKEIVFTETLALSTFIFSILSFFACISVKKLRGIGSYLSVISKFIFLFGTVLVFLVFLLPAGYVIVSGGHPITADILLTLFQTNTMEAIEYVQSQSHLLWASLFVLILTFLTVLARMAVTVRKSTSDLSKSYIFLLIFCICLFAVTDAKRIRHYYPINAVQETKQSLQQYTEYGKAKEERQKRLAALTNLAIHESAQGVYVLVIGESETRDHMHAYGYSRETTPWLDEMQKDRGMILFKNSFSNHTHTVPVLSYALSEKNQYNNIPLEKAYSILEVAKAAGYETWWISNQMKYGAWDTPVAEIASTADHEVWINGHAGENTRSEYYDKELVNHLPEKLNRKNTLIVIHLMGNHSSYNDHHPQEYNRFQGTDEIVDAYDGSVAYVDDVLKEVYEKVKEYPYFGGMVYFSDHGEDPANRYGHEATKYTPIMSRIPAFVYLSPYGQTQRPEIFTALQNNKNNYWSNDLVYDMLIGLLGISGAPGENPQKDITSSSYSLSANEIRTLHGKRSPLS